MTLPRRRHIARQAPTIYIILYYIDSLGGPVLAHLLKPKKKKNPHIIPTPKKINLKKTKN